MDDDPNFDLNADFMEECIENECIEINLSQEEMADLLMTEIEEENVENEKKTEVQEPNMIMMGYVREQRNDNTNRKTTMVIRRFRDWLSGRQVHEDILSMTPEQLNGHIGLFLMDLKKKDGGNMEPDSITSFHRGIDRFLRENNYPENIITSSKFASSRDVLAAKRKNLKSVGLGNKPNRAESLTDSMIERLWESGELGMDDGKSVQNAIFFFFTQGFGFRGSHESRQMNWGDVQLKVDEEGKEYLVFNEKLTKTRTGDRSSGCRAFAPKIFATEGERCPVRFYKCFAAHRPESMLKSDSPFYLCLKVKSSENDKVRYSAQPMGKNSISKFVPNMANNAGITGKITNYSLRKTTCQKLISSGVPPVLICQLTGHKNVNSLTNYTTADMSHQKAMSNIITAASTNQRKSLAMPPTSGPTSSATTTSSLPMIPASKPERMSITDRLLQSSTGMLTGATIHGTVNLNINYTVSSSQKMNVSPKAAIENN